MTQLREIARAHLAARVGIESCTWSAGGIVLKTAEEEGLVALDGPTECETEFVPSNCWFRLGGIGKVIARVELIVPNVFERVPMELIGATLGGDVENGQATSSLGAEVCCAQIDFLDCVQRGLQDVRVL